MKMQLQEMTDKEFTYYSKFSYENYIKDYAFYSKISIEKAREKTGNGIIKRTDYDLWYLAQVEAQIIGYFWIQTYPSQKDSFGFDIFINEEHRGKGYGRELIKQGKELLNSKGISKLRISVFKDNYIAKSLYDSLGFYIFETTQKTHTYNMQMDL